MKRPNPLLLLGSLGVIALDQVSKWAVSKSVPLYECYPVIDGFLNLVHVKNRGIAFGILNRPGGNLTLYLLTLMTLIAVFFLVFWFMRTRAEERGTINGLILIIGGAVGNLIDRVRVGEVIDFLDFHIGSFHWPAFNIADSAITVGTFWLALNLLFSGGFKGDGAEKDRRKL